MSRVQLRRGVEVAWILAPWIVVPGVSFLGLSLLAGRLDQRDLPGPASGQLLTRVSLVPDTDLPPPADALLIAWDRASGLGTLADMRLLMVLAAVAAVLGAMLAGRALAGPGSAGRFGAVGAGLAAATFSQLVLHSTWICYDTLALGLGWLGLGLSAWAADRGWRGLPVAALGMVAVGLSPLFKETTEPLRALLFFVPLVAWRDPLRALVLLCMAAPMAWYGPAWLESQVHLASGRGGQQIAPSASWEAAREGLAMVWRLLRPSDRPQLSFVLPLSGLAALGALLPGRRWLARLAAAALCLAAVGITAALLPQGWLRLRYLTAALFPIVVLAGLLAGRLAWLLRRLGPLSWAPPVALAGALAVDAVDALHEEVRLRVAWTRVEPADLPRPGRSPWRLNDHAVGTSWTHLAVGGGAQLWALMEGQQRPVATPTLMDERGSQVRAVAALRGLSSIDLDARRCCGAGPGAPGGGGAPGGQAGPGDAACARQVVTALDAAGVDLVLPHLREGDWRVPGLETWVGDLRQAAVDDGRLSLPDPAGPTSDWELARASGEGGALPCGWTLPENRSERPTSEAVVRGAWWADLFGG
ncbi:hypothetical protein L6R53_16790 [Myxococcota bacterium]|nr:hypothetical protein [Myxococcota bacterium]